MNTKLEKSKQKINGDMELLMDQLNVIMLNKTSLILDHVKKYDMKRYIPYFPSYHDISEVENTYLCHRVSFLNLTDPFTEEDDTVFMDNLERINCNIKRTKDKIDILNKKLIGIQAYMDAIHYANGLNCPTKRQILKIEIHKKTYSSHPDVHIYNIARKEALKTMLS